MGKHIAIIGNIGAGKTTLAAALCDALGGNVYLEGVEQNPFLELFYKDPHRWAFASAISFLSTACEQQKLIRSKDHPKVGIQERPALEQVPIFLGYRLRHNILTQDEYAWLTGFVDKELAAIDLPDVIIHIDLCVEELQRRIKRRGREFELSIPDALLSELNEGYEKLIKQPQISERLIRLDQDFDCFDQSSVNRLIYKVKSHL